MDNIRDLQQQLCLKLSSVQKHISIGNILVQKHHKTYIMFEGVKVFV